MQIQILKRCVSNISALTICILTFFAVAGCKFGLEEAFYRPNGVNERSKELSPLTLDSRIENSAVYQSKRYNFLILTDVHFGASYEVPETQILSWFDGLSQEEKPLFCIILGDMVENGNSDDFTSFNMFQRKLETKGLPVYCIVGNHDLLNSGWSYWKYNCNPHSSFYCFKTDTVSWYFTDTGSGTMGSKQLEALEEAFANDNNRKLVFSHYPLYGGGAGIPMFVMGNTKERARIINLFAENNVKYFFAGHFHPGGGYNFGSFTEFVGKTLKSGKFYLVSIDETTGNDANPVTAVEEIDIHP